jgi:hypothetical protein
MEMNAHGQSSRGDLEVRSLDRIFPVRREELPLPFSEGLPLLSSLASTVVSFIVLMKLPSLAYPILAKLTDSGSNAGPLSLSLFMGGWFEPLVGPLILTVISLAIHMAQRHYRIPDWLPFALALPVAVVVIAPSALELGGSWLAWLAFSVMAAGVLSFHWRVFTWARVMWD